MADRNLVLQLLITAKDEASSVFGKLFSYLNDTTNVIAGKVRDAFTGLFGGGLDGAIEFEAQLSKVQAKGALTKETMVQLRQVALDMGAKFGVSGTEAAKGMESLAAAGLNVKGIIAALPSVLALAAVEELSLDDASAKLVNSLTAVGLGFDQAGRLADVLAKGALESTTSASALAEALSTAGGIASSAGLNFEQTAAALTLLAKNGIQGSEAGTALSAILTQLINPASTASIELNKLGISSRDLGTVIGQLKDRGSDANAAILAFGETAGPGLRALIGQGQQALDGMTASMNDASGTAQDTADTMGVNLKTALSALSAAWEQLKTALLEPALEPLQNAATELTGTLNTSLKDGAILPLQETIKTFVTNSIDWARQFIREFDFSGVQKSVGEFATGVKDAFNGIKTAGQGAADVVTLAWAGVETSFRLVGAAMLAVAASAVQTLGNIETAASKVGLGTNQRANELKETANNLLQTSKEMLDGIEAAGVRAKAALDRLGEAGTQAAPPLQNLVKSQAELDAAVNQTRDALIAANEEFRNAQARGEDLTSALERVKSRSQDYRDALTAQNSAQLGANQSALEAKNELEKLHPALTGAAGGAKALAESTPAAAKGIQDIQWASEQGLPAQKEYLSGTNYLVKGHTDLTQAIGGQLPKQADINKAMLDYAGSADQGKTKTAQLAEELARVRQASDGWQVGMQLNVTTLNSLRDTAELAAQKLALLEERQRNGEQLDREVAAAKGESAQATARYTIALEANVVQQERSVAATQRANQLNQGEYDLYVSRAEAALELARIKGDANAISGAENDLLDARIAKANDAVVAQQREIEAYAGLIEATQRKLAATGGLDEAEKAQLATMADKLKGMEQERTALAQTAQAIQDKAAAEKEAAAAAKKAEEDKAKAAKEAADNAERETRRLAGATSAASEAFKQLSDAGREAWQVFRNFELKGQGPGAIASLIRGFNDVLEAELRAADGIDILVQAAEGVGPAADEARERLRDMAINGTSGIQGLTQAGEAARQKLEDIRLAALDAEQALAQMAGDFNRQILQLQGNQRAILELDHAENLRRLEEYYQTAGQLGSEEFATAKARAEELYRLKLAQLNAESKTGDSAAAGARTAKAWGEAADNAERFGKALNTVGAADLSRLQNQFALISNSATQLRDAL